ncbi:hypothetical protein Y032_0067g7 [Ancylostoma ceylanicum]|uniref:Uncharacterized protein n=1 Tax=Ancylostoma ceylanicum TaxID=53326 RepID=A0A016TZJ0_9BILA|nr:hypothetical protein Y032_0067g7 [Ancylostoma ceylanicum]
MAIPRMISRIDSTLAVVYTLLHNQGERTIAEAKAEIVETLEQIQEHYVEINRMRLEDRAKWKFFNQKVEELEVVKARALKQERKRLRDNERAKERDELEAKTFSKEFVITPYGFKKEPIKYPNLQQQREQAERKSKEAIKKQKEFMATAEEMKDPVERSKSKTSTKPSSNANKPTPEKGQKRRGLLEEALDSPSGHGSGSGGTHTTGRGSESEEIFVQIDKPMDPKKRMGDRVSTPLRKAKIVTVPVVQDADSESHSSEILHSSTRSAGQQHSRRETMKSKQSRPGLGKRVVN